jgi:hypothetical protein
MVLIVPLPAKDPRVEGSAPLLFVQKLIDGADVFLRSLHAGYKLGVDPGVLVPASAGGALAPSVKPVEKACCAFCARRSISSVACTNWRSAYNRMDRSRLISSRCDSIVRCGSKCWSKNIQAALQTGATYGNQSLRVANSRPEIVVPPITRHNPSLQIVGSTSRPPTV